MDGTVGGDTAAEDREDKERDGVDKGDEHIKEKTCLTCRVFQAVADAERKKAVLEITIQERIIEKEGAKNVSLINNEIKKEAENNEAEIAKFKLEKVILFKTYQHYHNQCFIRKLKLTMPCSLTSTSSSTWPSLLPTTQSFTSPGNRVNWVVFLTRF